MEQVNETNPAPQVPVITQVDPVVNKNSNHLRLVLVVTLVLVSLVVVSVVTFIALNGSQSSNSVQTTYAPTSTPTKVITPTTSPESSSSIQSDLDQATVTDPGGDVDQLNSDINQL